MRKATETYEDTLDYTASDYTESDCNCEAYEDIEDFMPSKYDIVEYLKKEICANGYNGSYEELWERYDGTLEDRVDLMLF